jgi:hypothetical protein
MVTTDPRFDSLILGLMLALAAALMVLSGAVTSARAFTVSPADVFINEIHYDNNGIDANEAIEIAGPAGTDLSGWSLVLYNGATGKSTIQMPSAVSSPTNRTGLAPCSSPTR